MPKPVGLVVVASLALACGKGGAGAPEAKAVAGPPLAPQFGGRMLALRGLDAVRGETIGLAREGTSWKLDGARLAPGTTLEVAGQKATAGADGTLTLLVPIAPTLGAIPLAALAKEGEPVQPALALTIGLPGAAPQTLTWPAFDGRLDVLAVIEDAGKAGTPLAFGPGDKAAPADPKAPTTIAPRRPVIVAGPGATLADVDRVAVVTRDFAKPLKCRGYRGGLSASTDLSMSLSGVELAIHDRRTGAELRRGEVVVDYKCPDKITTDVYRPGETIRLGAADVRAFLAKP